MTLPVKTQTADKTLLCARPISHRLFQRPTVVLLNLLIDLGHQADGFGERSDDAEVMALIVVDERAPFAVFEPLVCDLIAAHVEGPDGGRDTV